MTRAQAARPGWGGRAAPLAAALAASMWLSGCAVPPPDSPGAPIDGGRPPAPMVGAAPGTGAPPATSPAAARSARTPAPVPAYLTAYDGCALVVGGALGGEFTDPRLTAWWDEMDARVAGELQRVLAERGYRTSGFRLQRGERADDAVMRAAAQAQCNRLIQVGLEVNQDAQGRYFRYDISLLRMMPTAENRAAQGTPIWTVSEYTKSYRHARDAAQLQRFSVRDFVRQAAAELEASGKLTVLKPGAAGR